MNVESKIFDEYSRTLKVISLCSVCGEPVHATKYDKAARHGFKRYRKRRIDPKCAGIFDNYSQEDDKPCAGSGEEVVYKRHRNYKRSKK